MSTYNKRKRNNKSKISLWLDTDLVEIIKHNRSRVDLDEKLYEFLKDECKNSCNNVEVTLDSYPDVQNMVKLLASLDNESTKLLRCLDLCIGRLVDLGMDIFAEEEEDLEEDNSCDRLSDYYGAFHEYQDKQKENVFSQQKKSESYESIQKNAMITTIEQIKNFYNLDDAQLLAKLSNKQLIIYLLDNIDNNRDVVNLLNYKNIRNQSGKHYTRASIAKKRYLLKKSRQ